MPTLQMPKASLKPHTPNFMLSPSRPFSAGKAAFVGYRKSQPNKKIITKKPLPGRYLPVGGK
ncbi:hypothetical protein [Kingella oralis]|uniref:hypothetical protein n=1 Tax=Kingella oralis TaxID=505 RepID=UPI0034E5B249